MPSPPGSPAISPGPPVDTTTESGSVPTTSGGRLPVLLAASSLTVLAGAVVAPALPGIRAAFADSPGIDLSSRLVLTVPALAVALSGALVGRLADRWGRAKTLLAGLVLYGVAGTSGLWVTSMPALLTGRFFLGVAVAAVMTTATALLAANADGARRSRLLSLQAASMGLGGLAFLTVGGALADVAWRGPFFLYAVAWMLAPAARLTLGDDASAPRAPSSGGAVSIAPLLFFALAGMVLFYLLPVQLPFLFADKFEASAKATGLAIGGATLTSAAASLTFPRVVRALRPPLVLGVTFGVMGVGLIGVGLAPSLPLAAVLLLVTGAGTGFLMPNMSTWVAELVRPSALGRAMGRLTAALFLGQFVSPLVVAPLLSTGMELGDVIAWAGAASLVLAVGAVLVGQRLRRRSALPAL